MIDHAVALVSIENLGFSNSFERLTSLSLKDSIVRFDFVDLEVPVDPNVLSVPIVSAVRNECTVLLPVLMLERSSPLSRMTCMSSSTISGFTASIFCIKFFS